MSRRREHCQHEQRESIGDEFAEHHGSPVSILNPTERTEAFIKRGIVER
jgi:hypothetical protein